MTPLAFSLLSGSLALLAGMCVACFRILAPTGATENGRRAAKRPL